MAVEWEAAAKRALEGRLTEAQARTVINSILEHAGHESITFYKTKDWLIEWLQDKKSSREDATFTKYEQVVNRFTEHLGRKSSAGLGSSTASDIRSFRDQLHSEGLAVSTVNNLISKVLFAPLAKAVRLGYIPVNPCAAVEPLKQANTEAGVFTLDQIKNLVQAASTLDWKGLILAVFFHRTTVGRSSEADLATNRKRHAKHPLCIE